MHTHHHSFLFTYPMNYLVFFSSSPMIVQVHEIHQIIFLRSQSSLPSSSDRSRWLSFSYFYNICPILLYLFLSGLLCRCIYNTSIYIVILLSLSSHAWTNTYDFYHHHNIYICIHVYMHNKPAVMYIYIHTYIYMYKEE